MSADSASAAPKKVTGYKETLLLPKTDFLMKADLPQREPQILAEWEKSGVYRRVREKSAGCPRFVLHDGPPFANGKIHLGHALNKTLKDMVVRYRTMTGFDAPYVPGWDCHGLPIEHRVMKDAAEKGKTPAEIRKACAAYAKEHIEIQKQQFKRLGVWGEWDRPYLTLDPAYEADVLRVFADLVEKGLVYEGLRPVYWSTGCRTALAEAEIEYEDRTDPSIFAAFELIAAGSGLEASIRQMAAKVRQEKNLDQDPGVFAVVWTTTPWTLPANLAVAVHPDLKYLFVEDPDGSLLLLAESRLAAFEKATGRSYKHRHALHGREIEASALRYRPPFRKDAEGSFCAAEFVTADSGSGLVHIAPGHGHDDYHLGLKHGLKPFSPVDERGCLTAECGVPEIQGLYVFDANPKVIEWLRSRGALLAEEAYRHSYPHCWRSKTPIVFRSVKQWFIRVEAFKERALEWIGKVAWHPDWGRNRIQASVEQRQDWCISRQRTWGVPIPVFYDEEGGGILDAVLIRRFADRVQKEGTDFWFQDSSEVLALGLGAPRGARKGQDTLDVWIDSGSSFRAVLSREFGLPADLYLEGSDQHRGWFQSTLLLAAATSEKAPYRAVLTHGFVVDGQGRKMSKSDGNVIAPEDLLKDWGADILRLWVASSDYSDDIRASRDIFERIADGYRKIRNTFRYLLGNLHGFRPEEHVCADEALTEQDRWVLSRFAALESDARQAYESYAFHKLYQSVYAFAVRDLSSIYFDILKDRLYTDAFGSPSGLAARTVLYRILDGLVRILAPVLPFTCEEVWKHQAHSDGAPASVHEAAWPEGIEGRRDAALEALWDRRLVLRERILKALEEKREKKEIGNSLEAAVELSGLGGPELEEIRSWSCEIRCLVLVSEIVVSENPAGSKASPGSVEIRIRKARGSKCARCWMYDTSVGKDTVHADLCPRCADVVKRLV